MIDKSEQKDIFSFESIFSVIRQRILWIILCALAAGALTYWYAARQGFMYEQKASVLLRDDEKKSGFATESVIADLGLGLNRGAANLANETFVMKSTPVMLQTVEELGINVTYWHKSGIRTLELYRDTPLIVNFDGISPERGCLLTIIPRNEQDYTLEYNDIEERRHIVQGKFGEELTLSFATITVQPTSMMGLEWYGAQLFVNRYALSVVAEQLLREFTVTRPDDKEASLLELSLRSTHPVKTRDVLNRIIAVYNRFSIDEKTIAAQKTEKFIIDRLKELGGELEEVGDEISKFQEEGDIIQDTATTLAANFTAIQVLDQSIFDVRTQIKLTETLEESLTGKQSGERYNMLTIDSGIADAGIIRQIELFNEAYLEYRRVAESAGSRNPIVVSLRDRMDSTLEAVSRSIKNYQSNLSLRLNELLKKKEELDRTMSDTSAKGKDLAPLIREHKVKEELYLILLGKRDENALALYVAEPSARVLETAHGKDNPVAPKTKLLVLAGMCAGGGLSLFICLALGVVDTKVWIRQDLEEITDVPVVGELPLLTKTEKKSGNLFVLSDRSVLTECFHIVRNNVSFLAPKQNENQGEIVLVTSTKSGEGKTMVSSNLALAYAVTGKRVLLIDCDLRKALLTRSLKGTGRKGLTNILVNKLSDIKDVIHSSSQDSHLDILYSGPIPPNPVTLLTDDFFGRLLDSFKKDYDVIIIDSPPLSVLADTAIIAPHADACLYVVRSGWIHRQYLAGIGKLEKQGKLRHLAFVLNGVNFKKHRHRTYGYGYGYGYYDSDPDKQKETPAS